MTRNYTQYQYKTAEGVEKWVPAQWHNRLSPTYKCKGRRLVRRGGHTLICGDGTQITRSDFTGLTRQVTR